jgi:subtilisin inhibitor-like
VPPATRTLAAGPCTGAAVPPATRTLAAGPCTGAGAVRVLALLAAALLCGACAGQGNGTTGAPVPPDGLTVEVDRGDGSAVERYTLTCDGRPGGDHPDRAAACAHLAGVDDPFAPLPADVACTEQYGGPQTARVTGVWGGAPVDLELSRTDGCRIDQWSALGPLLPGPVGVLPD